MAATFEFLIFRRLGTHIDQRPLCVGIGTNTDSCTFHRLSRLDRYDRLVQPMEKRRAQRLRTMYEVVLVGITSVYLKIALPRREMVRKEV